MTFQKIYISLLNLWTLISHYTYDVIPAYRKENKPKKQNFIKSFHLKAAASTVALKPIYSHWPLLRLGFALIGPVVFDLSDIFFNGFGEVIW